MAGKRQILVRSNPPVSCRWWTRALDPKQTIKKTERHRKLKLKLPSFLVGRGVSPKGDGMVRVVPHARAQPLSGAIGAPELGAASAPEAGPMSGFHGIFPQWFPSIGRKTIVSRHAALKQPAQSTG
jgi:hypothetical protein